MAKQAFVAMAFTANSWNDKIYNAIKDVLEHAGYDCIRADEIKTSGPVVDEVCRLLREADLVIIDSSGDSHSVSYEIGYCHGINRPADRTLLLKNSDNLPFNYRHYRHLVYRDTRHLRRLLRDYLGMIEPISLGAYGYSYVYEFSEDAKSYYIYDGAACVFDALQKLSYSGRCECYSAEMFFSKGRLFVVGITLRPSNRQACPTYEYWLKLYRITEKYAKAREPKIKLLQNGSELVQKSAILKTLIPCGVAEFAKGKISRVLGLEDELGDSFFTIYLGRRSDNVDGTGLEI